MRKKLIVLDKKQTELTVPEMEVNNIEITFKENKLSIIPNGKTENVSPYIISKGLIDAVNAAIITGRPLLLKGEPGCGKTKLAKAVAAHFHGADLGHYYFEWHVKSKSVAKEGAYTFDHVRRLREATSQNEEVAERAVTPENYVELGPMGYAFVTPPFVDKQNEIQLPTILLIDEIDKGDIDFPNDLLLELDEMRFTINELEQKDKNIYAIERPLVFITSNDERELPPAFLRRCLYYRIPKFKNDFLEKIANKKLEKLHRQLEQIGALNKILSSDDTAVVVEQFQKVKKNTSAAKIPSTSELLDWLKLLLYRANETQNLDKDIKELIEDKALQSLALKLM